MACCVTLTILENEQTGVTGANVDGKKERDTKIIIAAAVSGAVVIIIVILFAGFCVRRKHVQEK